MATDMRIGSLGRAGAAYAVLALSLVIPRLVSAPRDCPPKPPWWEVHFIVTVRGDYSVKGRHAGAAGEYTCTAAWSGTMERDDEDFLLSCLESDIRGWEILEKGEAAGRTDRLTEKDAGTRPRFDLYYVLHEASRLRFVFRIAGPPVPLCDSPEKDLLVLPCSSEEAAEPSDYNGSVVSGDNHIGIEESDLEKAKVERKFSWEWKRRQWALRDGGAVAFANRHRAEVTVSLIRHGL